MGLKRLHDAKAVMIHVLGQKAEGDLERSWKAGDGMLGAHGLVLSPMPLPVLLFVPYWPFHYLNSVHPNVNHFIGVYITFSFDITHHNDV
ncbi:hypothetical protein K435DRAFT_870042 [Dendrothele bispora CBS 962.96]|uniref:Uncharacterized protein n=1 Tax=Dendrothele bispora (strain CBS 962.96) TaxID=1314807 RepID=A0A4S8L8A0_DENBC|nr:hypothetical protein K435DRAFT_870042 [Dendrothele bispora CBS 962.96]